jgi:membrane-bound serine protease (ClpP class)
MKWPRFRVATLVAALLLLATVARAEILKIVVDDVIHPISEEFIGRALDEAKARGDALVLIELRTPGGLETSTRAIVNRILSSKVPVAVYVSPSGSRAASAGFFILVAADVAAMAPGTNTGASHPVLLFGGEKIDEVMKQKMENDSAAFMRSVAAKRGRNVAVAESAVRESKSFTEQEALEQKVIDLVARDQADLLRQIDGRAIVRFDGSKITLAVAGQPVREKTMTLRQTVLSFIMDPNIAFILLSLGMLGLWAEFNHPGAILPGVVGGIAILLAVFALNILPTRFAALILILAAFALFALEAKLASHGVLGTGGVICMVIGALLLVDGPIPEMRVNLLTALAVSIPFGIIAVFLMSLVIRAHTKPVVTGEQGMIGEIGVARTEIAPAGKVFVHGEIWNAVAESPVHAGASVRVESLDGLVLKVSEVKS